LRSTGPRQLVAAARLARALFGRVVLRTQLAEMMPSADLAGIGFEQLLDDAARMSPETVVSFYRALDEWNAEARLSALRVPTLVLWGEKDEVVPRSALERTVGLLPRGRLEIWPGVGHSPQLERPERFVQLVADFARGASPWARLWARLQAGWRRLVTFLRHH
jgi:pimeloyl-ACP methyl ester carboxylesterase